MLSTILIIIVVLLLVGALPQFGMSGNYAPSTVLLVILIVLILTVRSGRF